MLYSVYRSEIDVLSNISQFDEEQIRFVISLAIQAKLDGGKPFGALIARDNQVKYYSHDKRHKYKDPTSHAELTVISEYCRKNKILSLNGYTLYCSTEPCEMCAGAIRSSQIAKVIYSVPQTMLQKLSGGILRQNCSEILMESQKIIGPVLPEIGIKAFENYSFRRERGE